MKGELKKMEHIEKLEIEIEETENELKQVEFFLSELQIKKLNPDLKRELNKRLESEVKWLQDILDEQKESLIFMSCKEQDDYIENQIEEHLINKNAVVEKT